MRLTPIEIRQHRFHTRMRGYDSDEVETFMETVVADFEEVVRENAKLRREAERLARELDAHRSREKNLQDTLTTAQDMVEQLKRTAVKEAEVMMSQAEVKVEKIIQEAEGRRSEVDREVAELRHLRQRLAADLRSTLQGYMNLIGAYEDAREGRTRPAPQPRSR